MPTTTRPRIPSDVEGALIRARAAYHAAPSNGAAGAVSAAIALASPHAIKRMAEQFLLEEMLKFIRDETLRAERRAETIAFVQSLDVVEETVEQKAEREERASVLRAENEAAAEARSNRLYENLNRIMADFVSEMKMEWTEELLSSTIRLSGNRTVTWGEATLSDHEERAAMFTSYAAKSAEGAARHQAAIAELKAAGVPTLNVLVSR